MKTIEISGQKREQIGGSSATYLRREEKVPAVIYQNGQASNIMLDYLDAKKVLHTPETYIVKLDIEGSAMDTIVREAQYHPVTDQILHVDFLAVGEKPVVLELPLKLEGSPAGVTKGGRLTSKLRKVKVKGVPTNMPDHIMVDVARLDLGQTVKVKEIAQNDAYVIMTNPSTAVASVDIPRSLRSSKSKGGEDGEGEEEVAE